MRGSKQARGAVACLLLWACSPPSPPSPADEAAPAPAATAQAAAAAQAPAPSAAPAPASACGGHGLPDCPLQQWMKANASPGLRGGDFAALERSFSRIAAMAPRGFEGWALIAQDGMRAAAERELEGCRVACKRCHDQHRPRYVRELRLRPL